DDGRGPLRACLAFGVGPRDERLTNSGITHLVEHLALQPLGHKTYMWNGMVEPARTQFVVQGSADDIVDFFTAVTRNLRDLPTDRLADELRVLTIEGDRRGVNQSGIDLYCRFGPRGPGLGGRRELGFRRVDSDEVVSWARTWFTSRNAAFWISGAIP